MRGRMAAVGVIVLLLGCNGSEGVGAPRCGDGRISGAEVCDGADLGGNDCTTIPGGYVGGELACEKGCLAFADARCTLPPGPTCTSPGDFCLRFTVAEGLDQLSALCGGLSGTWDALGTCALDGADLGYCLYPDLSFFNVSIPGGTARGYFFPNFTAVNEVVDFCESGGGTWAGVGTWTCGDGSIDGMEVCDGRNLGGVSCASLGATSGTIACAADCLSFDASDCSATVSCLMEQEICMESTFSGASLPASLSSFQAECESGENTGGVSGTYAKLPCPTAGMLGYCVLPESKTFYYPPMDASAAMALCVLQEGSWVLP